MARIRRARPADAPGIQRVARAGWHAAYDPIIGADTVDETVDEWYDPSRLVVDDIEPPGRVFLVAVETGSVVGFAEGVPDREDDGLAHLYRIYVTPERWGEGLGERLLERLETGLADRGVERLRVVVLAENDVGVGFYEATGFERIATDRNERFDAREYEYEKPL